MNEMIQEYNEPIVKSLVDAIVENADKTCLEAVEIVLDAWQHSKGHSIAEVSKIKPRNEAERLLN
jgi:hypothetical protein